MRHTLTLRKGDETIGGPFGTDTDDGGAEALGESDVLAKARPWFEFPHGTLRVELMDGSTVQFKYAVFVVGEAKRAIAVFTEHCGNHIFPYHKAKVFRDDLLVYEQAV